MFNLQAAFGMDLGPSFKVNRTVNEIIAQKLPVSLELGAWSMLVALGLGLPAGIIAALRPNTALDYVPSSFAKDKNRLSRALYRAGKTADVKKRWDFIDEVRNVGYGQTAEDPLGILKARLAKGEISQQEYERLRDTLAA